MKDAGLRMRVQHELREQFLKVCRAHDRLLVKSYDREQEPIANDGSSDYWPIPIGVDNRYCRLDIKRIHLAPSAILTDVKAAIAATGFDSLPITGP